MKNPRLCSALLLLASAGAVAAQPQVRPFESGAPARPAGRIDELVFARLAELGIRPARLCSDAVFLRRAYLDVIGTLPTPEAARRFLDSREAGKRALLIDELLTREELADYWAMKWGDLLRIKAEFPINLWPNAVQAYHRFVRTSLARNEPYDRFARELLTASGSSFRVPAVNFWRAVQGSGPEALADAVALTFMGTRLEGWPARRREAFAAVFSRVGFKSTQEWKEEIVLHDAGLGPLDPGSAAFPDGTPLELPAGVDPREAFADWLLAPDNPWFARAAVNRLWCWLLGRGIVHEPDDLRPDNPAVNPALLAYLEHELVASGYDLRHVSRLILNSTTYQLSSLPRSDQPAAAANFACYPLRRLEAEVLIDALCQVTDSSEAYESATPEPFTFLPAGQRAIALGDGSISSPFLELFGRPSRDTGLLSERSDEPSPAQLLHLLNSSHVREKIAGSRRLGRMLRQHKDPRRLVVQIYLLVLSRPPTGEELDLLRAYFADPGTDRRAGAADLVWALINSSEFLYRH